MSDQASVTRNSSAEVVLSARSIRKSYAEAAHELVVLDQLDFEVCAGERIAIVGSSGSGKSTLLNILSGLDDPTDGRVELTGEALAGLNENKRAALRNRCMGFVYQFHHLLAEFSALENVAMPLLLSKQPLKEIEAKARTILERVGLGQRLEHKPAQLSGGERQRVAIARALVTTPAMVLMDEPTGNLDRHTAEEIQALMLELNRDLGIAFVVVTHDLELAQRMDRVLKLEDGCLRPF
ncbi:lipoprotein-releasing ABC transporter ATP-binding protein LolD [Motiliproteus coralliicola]|uniref:Lipoprotein-releasing system ATP-binding protein LolD n=1 Tax=Motiliproteus coralliicola TaxID=2283196 RepID=A0A369WQB0_9GAMM|nr:lipoprotein-releasing ABC transporter ATP-binding protein LolD [Motiliproteus coralliicola]RDE24278.1 lipoprotein-releasing ABC transporter ATP-binding protein LolD [Motiliproteus coralliicola]